MGVSTTEQSTGLRYTPGSGWGQRILEAVASCRAAHPSYGPSVREVTEASGRSSYGTTWMMLRILEERGLIVCPRLPNGLAVPHSLDLTDAGRAELARLQPGASRWA